MTVTQPRHSKEEFAQRGELPKPFGVKCQYQFDKNKIKTSNYSIRCYDVFNLKKSKTCFMTTVTSMKCACAPCLCIVSLADAVMKDGKNYCSEGCANGHSDSKGCTQNGCGCGS